MPSRRVRGRQLTIASRISAGKTASGSGGASMCFGGAFRTAAGTYGAGAGADDRATQPVPMRAVATAAHRTVLLDFIGEPPGSSRALLRKGQAGCARLWYPARPFAPVALRARSSY